MAERRPPKPLTRVRFLALAPLPFGDVSRLTRGRAFGKPVIASPRIMPINIGGPLMDAISTLATLVFSAVLGVAALGFIGWCIESLWDTVPSLANKRHEVAAWLDEHAAPQWRVAHRLRSVQISIFWAVVGGLWIALPSFQQYLSPFRFAEIAVGFSLAILFARLTGQKGLPDA